MSKAAEKIRDYTDSQLKGILRIGQSRLDKVRKPIFDYLIDGDFRRVGTYIQMMTDRQVFEKVVTFDLKSNPHGPLAVFASDENKISSLFALGSVIARLETEQEYRNSSWRINAHD